MNQQVPPVLEVDAFAGSVRGEQNTDQALLRIILGCRLNGLTFVGPHAAIEHRQALAAEFLAA